MAVKNRANPGRIAAATALAQVDRGAHVEDALGSILPPGKDGALAWHIVFGVLRHRAQLDAALRGRLKQPLATLDDPVRAVLRCGTFEKLYARTPAHAVVHQWVEVAKKSKAGRARGLINAVLRHVQPSTKLSRAEQLDHPSWLVHRWDERYGEDATTKWCEKNRAIAPICLVTHKPEALAELVPGAAPAHVGDHILPNTLSIAAQARLPGIDEGVSWVQDPAAVYVTDLLVRAVGEGRVLDACAAPGGKTSRLWAHGLDVVATDLPHRIAALQKNLERIGAVAEVQAWDWRNTNAPFGLFDGILLDAPCTGLGTLRRHPEIRWRRKPTDFEQVCSTQRALLASVAQQLRPGGVLVYAVCSPEPDEGVEVVEAFLRSEPAFTLIEEWSSSPPQGDEDGHQAFVLRSSA